METPPKRKYVRSKMDRKKHPNGQPIGTISIKKNRGRLIAVIKTEKGWETAGRYFWVQANGEVPEGYVVSYKDGNSSNYELSNLMLTTKSQIAHKNYNPVKRAETLQKAPKIKKPKVDTKKENQPRKSKNYDKQWQEQGKKKFTRLRDWKKVEAKPLDLSNQIAVRIDHKTIIYIRPDQDKEAVLAKYKKSA